MEKDRQPRFRLTQLKPPGLVENDVEEKCLAELRRRNYCPFRLHCGRFRSPDGLRWITGVPKGTPDYAVEHSIFPGFLLETKRPGGELSRDQEVRMWELRQVYRLSICVADSVLELQAWLATHEERAIERWRRQFMR
jgi:hypothetical protein